MSRAGVRRRIVLVAVAAVLAVVVAELLNAGVRRIAPASVWNTVEPVLPTLVPAYASYTVPPHPATIVVTLALAVLLGVMFVALVACRVAPRRWWARLLLLWLGILLVGVAVVGTAESGLVLLSIEQFGGRAGSHLRQFTRPALTEAVRWGVIWGGVTAGLTVRLLPQRPPRRAGWVAIVLLLLGIGSLVLLGSATRAAALSSQTEVSRDPISVETPTDAPAMVAPSAEPSLPGRCSPTFVEMGLGAQDAASGRRWLSVTLTNNGPADCRIEGRPDLAFADDVGNEVRPARIDGPAWDGSAAEPELLTLQPGESARAELTWRGSGAGARTAAEVLVAPWPGAERTRLPVLLDLEDGTELGVSAWFLDQVGTAPDATDG